MKRLNFLTYGVAVLLLCLGISSCANEITDTGNGSDSLSRAASASDYTAKVTEASDRAVISFTSGVSSVWVDVHYKKNGGAQMNHRMTLSSGSTWTQTTTEFTLAAGDTVTYSFTYEKSGLAYDTAAVTYTMGGSTTGTTTTTTTALNTVSIASAGEGDVRFAITLASEKTQVHLFARKNGLQDYVVIDLQNTGETQNADGTYTYASTRLDSYQSGDLVEARFYTYSAAAGQVFYPGPGDSVFTSYTYTYSSTSTSTGTYTLVWSDEFTGTSLDTTKWNYDIGNGDGGWGNSEAQYYRAENVSVANGLLNITAKKESYGGFSYTSGRLNTKNKYMPKYGKIEIRALTPSGVGVWPAFWMLGSNIDSVGWPNCGEVDIMEIFGATSGTNMGTVHWFAEDINGYASYSGSATYSLSAYHVYTIEWTAATITWYLDGIQYHIVDTTPAALDEFKQSMYMILNLAVGGIRGAGDPAGNTWPQSMYVDYVRVYQK